MALTRTCAYAWVIFVASTVASLYCYTRISSLQTAPRGAIEDLRFGETFYGIGSADECIGYLKVNIVEENGEISIKGKGELRAIFNGIRTYVNLDSGADFNALRQLGGAYLRFSGEGGSLVLGLLNVHPIALSARLTEQGVVREWKASIDGPITVRKKNSQLLSLEGKSLVTERQQLQPIIQQPLFRKFALFEALTDGTQAGCQAKQGNALGIDSLIQFLKNINGSI